MNTHSFDKDYWEEHWEHADTESEGIGDSAPNPYLIAETTDLAAGTALDAGCGAGAEAIWLATHGWRVTAADISLTALARASDRAARSDVSGSVDWVAADLTSWEPDGRFDLVVTNYAHPAMPQLAFYRRISNWVAPGGTLLIVGHLDDPVSAGHGHNPPAEATVTLADIRGSLDPASWRIESAEERTRGLEGPGGLGLALRDVVVRAARRC